MDHTEIRYIKWDFANVSQQTCMSVLMIIIDNLHAGGILTGEFSVLVHRQLHY